MYHKALREEYVSIKAAGTDDKCVEKIDCFSRVKYTYAKLSHRGTHEGFTIIYWYTIQHVHTIAASERVVLVFTKCGTLTHL